MRSTQPSLRFGLWAALGLALGLLPGLLQAQEVDVLGLAVFVEFEDDARPAPEVATALHEERAIEAGQLRKDPPMQGAAHSTLRHSLRRRRGEP